MGLLTGSGNRRGDANGGMFAIQNGVASPVRDPIVGATQTAECAPAERCCVARTIIVFRISGVRQPGEDVLD
jgi:hypothetical protein